MSESTMNNCSITVEAYRNGRVTRGLFALEDHWSLDEGFVVNPRKNSYDTVVCTLKNLDFGLYDAQGIDYIASLLNCLSSDIISAYLEE